MKLIPIVLVFISTFAIADEAQNLADTLARDKATNPALDDPFPKVIKMKAPFVTSTIGYWAGATKHNIKTCFEVPEMADFVTVTTTKQGKVAGRGTCQVAPYCDSHGESCEDVTVTMGCWVRNDIYRWFKSQIGGSDPTDFQKEVLCNRLFPN